MKHSGFTLIELMIVMAIIAIALAIAVPAIQQFFGYESVAVVNSANRYNY